MEDIASYSCVSEPGNIWSRFVLECCQCFVAYCHHPQRRGYWGNRRWRCLSSESLWAKQISQHTLGFYFIQCVLAGSSKRGSSTDKKEKEMNVQSCSGSVQIFLCSFLTWPFLIPSPLSSSLSPLHSPIAILLNCRPSAACCQALLYCSPIKPHDSVFLSVFFCCHSQPSFSRCSFSVYLLWSHARAEGVLWRKFDITKIWERVKKIPDSSEIMSSTNVVINVLS